MNQPEGTDIKAGVQVGVGGISRILDQHTVMVKITSAILDGVFILDSRNRHNSTNGADQHTIGGGEDFSSRIPDDDIGDGDKFIIVVPTGTIAGEKATALLNC